MSFGEKTDVLGGVEVVGIKRTAIVDYTPTIGDGSWRIGTF